MKERKQLIVDFGASLAAWRKCKPLGWKDGARSSGSFSNFLSSPHQANLGSSQFVLPKRADGWEVVSIYISRSACNRIGFLRQCHHSAMLAAGHCVGRVPPCFLHLGMMWAPSALDESNPVCPCVCRQYQVDSVGPMFHWFSCFSRHLIMARTLQHPLTSSNQIENNHQILCDPRQGKRRQLSEKGSDYLIQAVTTQMSKLGSSRRSSPVIRRCLGRASLDSPKSQDIPRYPK
jgi:hypothetical protein